MPCALPACQHSSTPSPITCIMGRLASSQVLQTVTWKRIHGGEKKNKSKNKKQPVKQAESLFFTPGGQSHLHDWDAGESHTHLGASCVSLRFCALCHDRTLLRILIALFCHCLAIYRDNHTEVRWTQDPDSAGLICFKEDTDCRGEVEYKDGGQAPLATQPSQLSGRGEERWPPVNVSTPPLISEAA